MHATYPSGAGSDTVGAMHAARAPHDDHTRDIRHDGAYGTLLAEHLRGGETADDLCIREPARVVAAHLAYLEAGATVLQTNAFLAFQRGSDRRRRALQLAALECARDAVASFEPSGPADDAASPTVAATLGPAGEDARDYWRDLELVLDHGVRAVRCETLTTHAGALAVLDAWRDVAAGVSDVVLILGCSVAPVREPVALGERAHAVSAPGSASAPDPASWLRDVAARAPALARVGLNCCAGPDAALRPLLEAIVEERGAVWFDPSAGLPARSTSGALEWPLAPRAWADATRQLVEGLPLVGLGGCCGTTPAHLRALSEPDPS